MVVLGLMWPSGNNCRIAVLTPPSHCPCCWLGQGAVGCCQPGVSGGSVSGHLLGTAGPRSCHGCSSFQTVPLFWLGCLCLLPSHLSISMTCLPTALVVFDFGVFKISVFSLLSFLSPGSQFFH